MGLHKNHPKEGKKDKPQPSKPSTQAKGKAAVTSPGSGKKAETEKRAPSKKEEQEPLLHLTRKKASNALRFSPRAWAKLIWLRDRGNTEISVFGVSRLDDLLYVEDVKIIKQVASVASFNFDEEYLNHYLVDMVQAGRQPCEVFRIWIHTHPGGASPSGVDIETFERTTKQADWGVMCIIGKDDVKYARMRLRVSGGLIAVDVTLDVQVDWSGEFAGVTNEDAKRWNVEYKACVSQRVAPIAYPISGRGGVPWGDDYGPDIWPQRYSGLDDDRGFLSEEDVDTPLDEDDNFFGAQKIYLIELDGSGDTVVYTEYYWFEYTGTPELKVKEDMEVGKLSDICEKSPEFWGEVKWCPEGSRSIAHKTSLFYDGALVQLKEGEPFGTTPDLAEEPETEEKPQDEPVGP